MRTANDKRLFLDKADGVTTYGLFPDQRFYSVQYTEADDNVLAFRELVLEYNDWCKEAYLAVRQGIAIPPFPVTLADIVDPPAQPQGIRVHLPTPEEDVDEPEAQSDTTEG